MGSSYFWRTEYSEDWIPTNRQSTYQRVISDRMSWSIVSSYLSVVYRMSEPTVKSAMIILHSASHAVFSQMIRKDYHFARLSLFTSSSEDNKIMYSVYWRTNNIHARGNGMKAIDLETAIQTAGRPATTASSIPHSLVPLMIRKKPGRTRAVSQNRKGQSQWLVDHLPFSPHSTFHELATSQYGVPSSTPHPIILTAWPPSTAPATCCNHHFRLSTPQGDV